jgi:hypothetical protein
MCVFHSKSALSGENSTGLRFSLQNVHAEAKRVCPEAARLASSTPVPHRFTDYGDLLTRGAEWHGANSPIATAVARKISDLSAGAKIHWRHWSQRGRPRRLVLRQRTSPNLKCHRRLACVLPYTQRSFSRKTSSLAQLSISPGNRRIIELRESVSLHGDRLFLQLFSIRSLGYSLSRQQRS